MLLSNLDTVRNSFVTGLYTAGLTLGAAFAGAITTPISDALGSWPTALAVWAAPAALGIPAWYLSTRDSPSRTGDAGVAERQARPPWRNRWAMVLMVFSGGSSTMFFFVLTWLAPRYVALGWTANRAGVLLSVFVITQLGGNLVVSAFGDRLDDRRPLFALMGIVVVTGAIGVAFTPRALAYLWALCLGVGAGGLFTLALTLPVTYAGDATATDGLTSMMLGGGYLIAALGPFVAGLLRDITDSYVAAFAGLAMLGAVLLAMSMRFTLDRALVT